MIDKLKPEVVEANLRAQYEQSGMDGMTDKGIVPKAVTEKPEAGLDVDLGMVLPPGPKWVAVGKTPEGQVAIFVPYFHLWDPDELSGFITRAMVPANLFATINEQINKPKK